MRPRPRGIEAVLLCAFFEWKIVYHIVIIHKHLCMVQYVTKPVLIPTTGFIWHMIETRVQRMEKVDQKWLVLSGEHAYATPT